MLMQRANAQKPELIWKANLEKENLTHYAVLGKPSLTPSLWAQSPVARQLHATCVGAQP